MAKVNKGTVALGWCDNGNTDGKFTEGMVSIALQAPANGIEITHSMRVQGNQIGRQRQVLFDYWADQIKTDWLLWVDSDIVMDIHVLTKVWDAADKIGKPVVTGTYFISKQNEGTLAQPFPALFHNIDEHTLLKYIYTFAICKTIVTKWVRCLWVKVDNTCTTVERRLWTNPPSS